MMRLGLDRPREARGFLPLILGAIAAGKAIYGAVNANQVKQRNKGYINDAYRTATARMTQQQAQGSQANLESLNARGMLGAGVSPVHAAMTDGRSGATNLGEQSRAELSREYALDRHSLDAAHDKALNENKADALNAQIGSIAGGMQGMASAYAGGQEMAATQAMSAPSPQRTPIASAMLSGSAFDGVHPVDPLGDPSSSWHMGPSGTSIGMGQPNFSFNAGNG